MTTTPAGQTQNEPTVTHIAGDYDTQEWAPDWLDQEIENRERLIGM